MTANKRFTFRASLFPIAPVAGALLASPSGAGVFRIEAVTRMSEAGSGVRALRIDATPIDETPPDVPLFLWPSADRARRARIQHRFRGAQ